MIFGRTIVQCQLICFLLTSLFAPLVLSQSNYSENYRLFSKTFNYAGPSSVIRFTDWISLLTLCLTPLALRILAGVPRVIYVAHEKPRWHDWIGLYNPTSILWRYFAIAARRLRHKEWCPADMAATNTYFWTTRGWVGSEEMMEWSRKFCTQPPPQSRAAILSSDSVKTIIITLQGAQAIYNMLAAVLLNYEGGNPSFDYTFAVDAIFSPLAVFGLLRLFAALWLTDDYFYTENLNDLGTIFREGLGKVSEQGREVFARKGDTVVTMRLLKPSDRSLRGTFLLQSSWRAIALRIFYLLPLYSLLAILVLFIVPFIMQALSGAYTTAYSEYGIIIPPTSVMLNLFYLFFILVSILTFTTYFVLGQAMSTVIPCIGSITYKVYSCLLVLMTLALIVVTSIYTRRTPCGKYTTYNSWADSLICNGAPVNASGGVGLVGMVGYPATNLTNSTANLPNLTSDMLIVYLNGWCSGTLVDGLTQVVAVDVSSTGS